MPGDQEAELSCWSGCRVSASVGSRTPATRHHSSRAFGDMTHPVLRSYTGLVLIGVGVFCLGIGVLVASPADTGIVQRPGLKGQD